MWLEDIRKSVTMDRKVPPRQQPERRAACAVAGFCKLSYATSQLAAIRPVW